MATGTWRNQAESTAEHNPVSKNACMWEIRWTSIGSSCSYLLVPFLSSFNTDGNWALIRTRNLPRVTQLNYSQSRLWLLLEFILNEPEHICWHVASSRSREFLCSQISLQAGSGRDPLLERAFCAPCSLSHHPRHALKSGQAPVGPHTVSKPTSPPSPFVSRGLWERPPRNEDNVSEIFVIR